MNKKLISLLLAICIVIGLLPVMSIAEESDAAVAKVAISKADSTGNYTLEAVEGGEPVYGKSVAFDGTKSSGAAAGTGYEFTKDGASSTEWNFKFEYPLGGTPTLTLKNAKLINLDANGSTMYKDGTSTGTWTAIQPRNEEHPLKVVLQGENVFQVDGIMRAASSNTNKFASVTVVGEEGSSLVATAKSRGFQSKVTAANSTTSFTFENANITLSTNSTSAGADPIYTENGNITIKNSTLKLTALKGTMSAIHANGTGTITVNNSALELTATGTAFNKAPTLSEGATIVAGDDADSAVSADASALTTAKYAKVTYPAPTPGTQATTQATSAPTTGTTAATTVTSEPTTAPTVGAPAVDTTKPSAPATSSGTVSLWGNSVTVSGTNALYWVNGGDGATPAETTDENNWNYSFRIIDGIPTVTLKNASYSGDKTFLSATYDGCLKVAYEGTNNIVVPYTQSSTSRYFINYKSTSNTAGKGKLFIEGADNATLNVTGGDNSAAMLTVGNKADLTIYGGTVNLENTYGGTYGVINAGYSNTIIQDCTLKVKHTKSANDPSKDRFPAVCVGGYSSTLTITNANVDVETNAHAGICVGIFDATMGKINNADNMTVDGNSHVKVVTNSGVSSTKDYNGVGIYAANLVVKCGNLEVEGNKKAVHIATADTEPNLSNYNGKYDMFTEKGGAAVTTYTATTYFKVVYTGAPDPTTAPATVPTTAPSTGSTTGATTAPTTPAAGVALPKAVTVKVGGVSMRITKYDVPVYTVNTTTKLKDMQGNQFDVIGQSITTDANNWNAKFVWHANEATPTLYIDRLIIDDYNEEASKWRAYQQNNPSQDAAHTTGIAVDVGQDVKIVITGADSLIKTRFGINFKSGVEIKSEGDAQLKLWNLSGVIYSSQQGAPLVVDANLDMYLISYYNGPVSHGLMTLNADITINGGNIKININNNATGSTGIYAKTGGNITINGGNIDAKSKMGTSYTTGVIYAETGKVTITDGYLKLNPTANVGVFGKQGVEISGGTLQFYSPTYGINAGKDGVDGPITITGGTVEIVSGNGAFFKKPILGPGVTGYAGKLIKYAVAYNPSSDYLAKYVKIGLNVSAPDPNNMPEVPGADPNNPGDDPSAPEIEPTVSPTAAPGLQLPQSVSVKVGGVTMTITKYDVPVYTKNTTTQLKDRAGNVFDVIGQSTTTDAENWNAKFVWHADQAIPTLYLDGLKIDDYNEEASKWRAWQQNNPSQDDAHTTGIEIPSGRYMKIIITGEDSEIKTRFGINYSSKIHIQSEDDAKLKLWNLSGALFSKTKGIPLVVDANLDVTLTAYYQGAVSQAMMTLKADITINGGNINIKVGQYGSTGIQARDGGDIIINGGNITVNGRFGEAIDNGSIDSDGKIIINGGTVDANSLYAAAMYAKGGIEINDGIVNLTSAVFGMNAGTKAAPGNIFVNGGTTTVIAQHACYTGRTIIGPGMYAYVGAGSRSAEIYDGTDTTMAKKPWFFATDDESKKIEIEEDDEYLGDDFFEDPTEDSTAPSDPTATDPSVAPDATEATEATEATTPVDEIPEDENYYNVTPNLNITGGISEEIPDALIDMGIDSADMIRDILVENVWAIDDYSDYFAFFDITLMYHDGEDWVKADEEHFPEDGYITAMLPYPEGTDIDTPFTAVHMFTSDAFGLTPGEVELLMPINTDEGILVELSGLSPVAIAWEGPAENPPTGDMNVTMYMTLMVVALLGMATTVVYSKKRRAQ